MKRPRARDSLQYRFMSIVVAGAVLFAAAAGGLAYRAVHERALASGRATIEGLVTAVEKTAAIGAYATDKVLLAEVVQGLARNPLVARVEVLAAGGAVLAGQGVTARATAASTDVFVDRRLGSPFDAKEAVGSLRVQADMQRLETGARAEARVIAMLLVLQTGLVALLLYLVAARFVSKPIVRLAAALRETVPGSSLRLGLPPRHERDEIGRLIAGANELLAATELAMQRERDARAVVERMEAQYRQIFDSSSAGIFVLDAEGRLINSNPTALKVIGLSLDVLQRLRGQEFVNRVFARPERVLEMMSDAADRSETVSSDLELVSVGEATRWVHCLISVQGKAAQRSLIEGVMYDITDRKHNESAVRHQAEHDALTGLKNRAATEIAIDRFIDDASANTASLSVIYIDLDGFKQINDRHGHKAGDQVLVHCAARMQAVLRRTSDVAGRVGGDEFVVALNHLGGADPVLNEVAMQLLDRISAPIRLDDGQSVRVGASLGIATYPRHGSTRKQLLHTADAAMYEVKRHGKNSYAMAIEASAIA